MYGMSDLKVGKVITFNGAPFQITKAEHSKQARAAAVLRVKMKNVVDGSVMDHTFQQNDTIQPADLQHGSANFQYADGDDYWFMHNETFDQFALDADAVGNVTNFVKEGEDVDVLFFEGKPVSVALPPKVVLEVVDAPPGVKGDTAGNVTKKVTLETGYEIPVPLFIKKGEKIRVNTETGDYVERAND